METILLDKKQNKMSFIIKKTTPAFVNTLRRLIIDEVPTMAIEDVEFRKNDSVLYDEMVALRLGLLPLTTDLRGYNLPGKCTCKGEGCAKCQVEITLKTKASGTILANKLKSKDPKIKPVYEDMPITKLEGEQELEFVAKAQLGKGKVHTKWSPGLAFFKQKPIIKINNPEKCLDAVKVCPLNIFEEKNGKAVVNKDNVLLCHLCNACIDACPKNSLEVYGSEEDYIFNIESWGQLKPKQIVERAIVELTAKLDEFKALVNDQL